MDHKNVATTEGRIWTLMIIGLSMVIYGYSLSNSFIWDDNDFLVANRSLGSLRGLLDFWTPSDYFFPVPLTASFLWVQHQFWGLAPWGYHAVSLTLHVMNSLLLFSLLRRAATPLAGFVALLFAVHPIQVETVAWISEQKNLLCFFFFMLAFHAFIDFDSKKKGASLAKIHLFFIAGGLSKSIAFCFVAVPILWEWWKRGAVSRRNLLLSLSLVFFGALSVLNSIRQESFFSSSLISKMLWGEKFILAGKNFFFYMKQIILPWHFSPVYPMWDIRMFLWQNWIYPFAVVALFFVLFQFRRNLGRGAFALLCFYGVSIFPVLGFLKISILSLTYASDHFSYLSVPSVLLLCCSAIWLLIRKVKDGAGRGPSPVFVRMVLALAVLYLSLVSFRLTLNYKDDIVFFGELFAQDPKSIFANTRLGVAYERKGDLEKAKQIYLRGSYGVDFFTQASRYRDIARIFVSQKKPYEALLFMEKSKALRARRGYSFDHEDYHVLGGACFLLGDYAKAAEAFHKGIAVSPRWTQNYAGLGMSLLNLGDVPEAVKVFDALCRMAPWDAEASHHHKYAKEMLSRMLSKSVS